MMMRPATLIEILVYDGFIVENTYLYSNNYTTKQELRQCAKR